MYSQRQNYPSARNNQNRRFVYSKFIDNSQQNKENRQATAIKSSKNKKDKDYIAQLQLKLKETEQKYRKLEQTTVQQQMNVLEQINILEDKFTQVNMEKQYYRQEIINLAENCAEFHKIKGVSIAMINMMKKVQGKDGDLHEAWKWVKKIIMEYQTIKKKALQWKKGFDAFKALANSTQSEQEIWERRKTFSNCSQQLI